MCTCLEFKKKDLYFGRTLDLEYHYNEEVVITPRNYEFNANNAKNFKNKYALIGTAMVLNDYPLYYEAVNEEGLCMAGLNFPYNAKYLAPQEGKLNLTVSELIPFILGNYKTIKELRKDLNNLVISDVCFAPNMPLTPLHFMLSDKEDCIVLEQTIDGLKIYENNTGVMTNNPTFDLQLENLEKYKDLSSKFKEADDPKYGCVGLGALGLPGDYSSMSRFIKTYFMKENSLVFDKEEENVTQFFHILDSVSMVKGSVLTKTNLPDMTFYTCCINASKGIYYYKTYDNNQISVLKMNDENKCAKTLTRFQLITKQNFNNLN